MINAEVTAENRPAYEPGQDVHAWTTEKTDEDESGVQVFVVLLDELSIVIFCFVAIHLVEPGPVILLG